VYQKKTKEVIEKHMGEMNHVSSIMELTRTGARMMLQIAIEEELLAFLDRDYYERRTTQKGSRSGYKLKNHKNRLWRHTLAKPHGLAGQANKHASDTRC
jgi:transposase-like protein